MLSQLPLTIVSGAGHATEETLCECPPSSCFEASTRGAVGAAAPVEPFFAFLAPASCAAAADSSAALSAMAEPAVRNLLSGFQKQMQGAMAGLSKWECIAAQVIAACMAAGQ